MRGGEEREGLERGAKPKIAVGGLGVGTEPVDAGEGSATREEGAAGRVSGGLRGERGDDGVGSGGGDGGGWEQMGKDLGDSGGAVDEEERSGAKVWAGCKQCGGEDTEAAVDRNPGWVWVLNEEGERGGVVGWRVHGASGGGNGGHGKGGEGKCSGEWLAGNRVGDMSGAFGGEAREKGGLESCGTGGMSGGDGGSEVGFVGDDV